MTSSISDPQHPFDLSIAIAAPAERVWQVISDIDRWAEWTPSIRSVKRLQGAPFAVGSRVLVRMNKNNVGYWKMSLTHARLTLPLATDPNILITGVWGTDLVASQRLFEAKRSKPGSQKLFYRGIATGGM